MRRFRAIVAAPFVLLTPLFLALHFAEIAPTFAWFAFLTNSIGAAADLLTLWALRCFDRAFLVEDTGNMICRILLLLFVEWLYYFCIQGCTRTRLQFQYHRQE